MLLRQKPTMLSSLSPCPSPNSILLKFISSPSLNPNPRFISFPLNSSNPSIASATVSTSPTTSTAPERKKRKAPRRFYPGESEGIAEEIRFVAMRIRDDKAASEVKSDEDTWQPGLEGFLKYLVDSKLVFETVEQIINDWNDPAYIHFRKRRLERTERIMKDLDWFEKQGCTIPEPSPPGKRYSTYLKKLAESSAPSFLCHYYNLYFAHATGGVGIGLKVKQKLLGERELEFYNWDGDVQLLLKDVRDKLNKLGMQWTREEKNKCLKEAAKSFRFMGQIIRHIVLL